MGSMATPPQGGAPKTQKGPVATRPPGGQSNLRYATGKPLFHVLAPIKRIRPGPRSLGAEQAISRADEVVGRVHVICRVGDDRTPPIQPRTRLHGSHQAQLKPMSTMLPQHPNAAEIAR